MIFFMIIVIFCSSTHAVFNVDELFRFQECDSNTPLVITCNPKCNGCRLETGRLVYCPEFSNSDEIVLLRGVLNKRHTHLNILHYIRIGCFYDDPITGESTYKCPDAPITQPTGEMRCQIEHLDEAEIKSSSKTSSRPKSIQKIDASSKIQKQEDFKSSAGRNHDKQVQSYVSEFFFRLLSAGKKWTLIPKEFETTRKYLEAVETTQQNSLVMNDTVRNSKLSGYESHLRSQRKIGCSTTNMAGVSVRDNLLNCFPVVE